MHKLLADHSCDNPQKSGEDLAIISGDIFFSLGISLFNSNKEDPLRKSLALETVLDAAVKTGLGEMSELLLEKKDIEELRREEILKIYDYKSAYYTISAPLKAGAILAGASEKEVILLGEIGNHAGRAFQIKDDILDITPLGKSRPEYEDLRLKKKNLLMYYAYKDSDRADREFLRDFLNKKSFSVEDSKKILRIYQKSGSVKKAEEDIVALSASAEKKIKELDIPKEKKSLLAGYFRELLSL